MCILTDRDKLQAIEIRESRVRAALRDQHESGDLMLFADYDSAREHCELLNIAARANNTVPFAVIDGPGFEGEPDWVVMSIWAIIDNGLECSSMDNIPEE